MRSSDWRVLVDVAYLHEVDNLDGYIFTIARNRTLNHLRKAAIGVVMLDMTDISEAIYRRKKAKDCIVNPLHPNDYMARWYAQGMVEMVAR